MWCRGSEVGIANTIEDTEVIIRGFVVKELVWDGFTNGRTWPSIEEVRRCGLVPQPNMWRACGHGLGG